MDLLPDNDMDFYKSLLPDNDMDFYKIFAGKKEVPYEENFVEKVVLSLQVDLSPAELTRVKWLAFKKIYLPHSVDLGECWRNVQYTELDREEVTDIIMYLKTAHREMPDVPEWFRDYHEFGLTEVKSPYDNTSSCSTPSTPSPRHHEHYELTQLKK